MENSVAWSLGALVTAWALVMLLGPYAVKLLTNLKMGQQVRSDGPQTHLQKSGTPTMGGVLFIGASVLAALFWSQGHPLTILAALGTLGFALIGFVDDYRKMMKRGTTGLKAREKLAAQGLLALAITAIALWYSPDVAQWVVPWTGATLHIPPWLFVPVAVFVVVGGANAVNLTDGLDGLAAGCMVIASAAFAILLVASGTTVLISFVLSVLGGCLAFLWFNTYPAAVFMGDTGSLGLGAALVFMGLFSGTTLFLPLIGVVFVVETISVMLQVLVFRVTKGRRLFRMAPLHHHFELLGWAEPKVIVRFWIAAALGGLLGIWVL